MATRRHIIALAIAQAFVLNLLINAAPAQAQAAYPSKTVRIIVPVAAGGPTDLVARMLADKLSKTWGQQVIVENKPGAGTNIGNEFAARANPDGHTILFATGSLAVNKSLYRSLAYDAVKDFAPVSLVTEGAYFAFVPNSSPAKTLKQFIDHVKANPGKLAMASPGTGSAPYLAEMLFLQMAGLKMTHVPYRGASLAFNDLIPGRVHAYFGTGALLTYSKSGQVRVLATTGAKRDSVAPEVPTVAEAGIPGYAVMAWQATFVPAKTPPDIVRKISADINAALRDPAIKDKLAKSGYLAAGSSPEALCELLKAEIAKWGGVIKSMGLKIK